MQSCKSNVEDTAIEHLCGSSREGFEWIQGAVNGLHAFVSHLHRSFWFPVSCSWQAPWDLETCKTSIKVNGIYEASGLALWLRTGAFRVANTPDSETAPGDVSVETLSKFAESFFSKDAAMKASIQRGSKKSRTGRERLVWPIEMIVVTGSSSDLEKDGGFDSSLNLVGCHFVLWAWYYAMFDALQKAAPRLQTWIRACLTKVFNCMTWLPHSCAP